VVASPLEVRGSSQLGVGDAREISTGTSEVACRVAERVAIVTLNRPEAKNALTMEMKRALTALLPELGRDTGVGCVLLTGAGAAFCAGGDTKRMQQEGRPASAEDRIRQLRWEHGIVKARAEHCTKRPFERLQPPLRGSRILRGRSEV
jgi:enoyl-CoA hydratase/carnithine racemase